MSSSIAYCRLSLLLLVLASLCAWSAPQVANVASSVEQFDIAPIAAQQWQHTPFPVTVTTKDSAGNPLTDVNGEAKLQGWRLSDMDDEVLLDDSFEDGNFSGWLTGPNFGDCIRTVTTATAAVGTHSLKMDGPILFEPQPNTGLWTAFYYSHPRQAQFYVRKDDTTTNGGCVAASDDVYQFVKPAYLFQFRMRADGVMGLDAGDYGWFGTPYAAAQWYKITLDFDWESRTIDFSVNDALIAVDVPFRDPLSSISVVFLSNEDQTVAYWDDIRFTGEYIIPVQVSPSTVTIQDGQWSGDVTVDTLEYSMWLDIADTQGHYGKSTMFNVEDGTIPRCAYDMYWTHMNTALEVPAPGVLANDYTPNGAALRASLWRLPEHGTVTMQEDGSFHYTPENGYLGQDAFSYWATSSQGMQSFAWVTMIVTNPVDHYTVSPVASPQIANAPFPVTLTAADTGGQRVPGYNTTAILSAWKPAASGVVMTDSFEDGNFDGWQFEPGAGGQTYTVTTSTAAAGSTRSLQIDGPQGGTGGSAFFSYLLGRTCPTELQYYVRSSDAAKNGAVMFATAGGYGANGILFAFMMLGDINAPGYSNRTMGLLGQPWTNVPYVANQWYKISLRMDWQAKTIDFYIDDVLVSDDIPFVNTSYTYMSGIHLMNGQQTTTYWDEFRVTGEMSTSVPITPTNVNIEDGQWAGTVTVLEPAAGMWLEVADDEELGGDGAPFDVIMPNDPPVANDQTVATAHNTPLAITLTATDADGNPLTYAVVGAPQHGTLTGNAPRLTYTPHAGWSGSDHFTFVANDGIANSNTATVTVTTARPLVTVRLLDSAGHGIAGGTVSYYAAGVWHAIGVTGTDGAVAQLLDIGPYTFRVAYRGGVCARGQYVATNTEVVFRTVPVTIELRNSAGDPVNGGAAQCYTPSGWQPLGITAGGQVQTELLPASHLFAMTFAQMRLQQQQHVGDNPVVVFRLPSVTVKLLDSQGNGVAGAQAFYYLKGWCALGVTGANGAVTADLAPGYYAFRVTYAGGSSQRTVSTTTTPEIVFHTVRVTVELRDHQGIRLDADTVEYYAGAALGWRPFGTTAHGQGQSELLPGSYPFAVTYAYRRAQQTRHIGLQPTVTFQTGQVYSSSNTCSHYYAGSWRAFTAGMQLLPGNYLFRFTSGTPAQQTAPITAGVMNVIR